MTEKVELTPELLRELQLKQLDMLVYFRDFCEKNNLTFYLIGGALIGALRNGGFVPWDDDVDVMLPREEEEQKFQGWLQLEARKSPTSQNRQRYVHGQYFYDRNRHKLHYGQDKSDRG